MNTHPDAPMLSVLMTSYNRERYIGEAIESVLASTFRDFELIIVDDRSKDDTLAIAKSYADRDPRIRVYLNEQNLGDYPNRNKAASYARGRYLTYLDADDAIYKWGFEMMIEMMERHPEAGYGLNSIIQFDDRIFPVVLSPEETYRSVYEDGRELFEKAPSSAIIRREVFEAENGFTTEKMVGDMELWHRLALKYKVVVMPHGIVWSRGHEDSQSGMFMKNYQVLYRYVTLRKKFIARSPLPEPLKAKLDKELHRTQCRLMYRALLEKRTSEFREIRKDLGEGLISSFFSAL